MGQRPSEDDAAGAEPGTFLALLDAADREPLLELGGRRKLGRGVPLMHQEEPGNQVALLLAGHVKTTFVDHRGQEMVLSFRGPGDVLGELSFIRAEPRSSNVVTIEPVAAQVIAASEFRAFLERHPRAALALIDVISRRFRDANRKRVQFGELDTLGRLAARLVELSERHGRPAGGEGSAEVEIGLPITQEDLAGWTASSRAGVAAALRTMRELGWVRTERRRIVVLDADALRARSG